MSDENASVVVEVTRQCCGHNVRVGDARIAEGPDYVKCHIDAGPLAGVCLALVEGGHTFSVRFVDEHVSMLEWLGASKAEVESFNAKLRE